MDDLFSQHLHPFSSVKCQSNWFPSTSQLDCSPKTRSLLQYRLDWVVVVVHPYLGTAASAHLLLLHDRRRDVRVVGVDQVSGWEIKGHHKDLARLRTRLAHAQVPRTGPDHLREMARVHIRVQQVGLLVVVILAHGAVPERGDFLTCRRRGTAGKIGRSLINGSRPIPVRSVTRALTGQQKRFCPMVLSDL